MLDANSSRKRSMGFRSQRNCQDRSDNDDGVGHQGRREQIRHVGEKLRRSRWKTRSNPTRRPARMRSETKDYE